MKLRRQRALVDIRFGCLKAVAQLSRGGTLENTFTVLDWVHKRWLYLQWDLAPIRQTHARQLSFT